MFKDLAINTSPSYVMHVDLNSCFAAIEQQANPKLRGFPTLVAAYPTGGGCVVSPSVEAKKLGVKTGMRVRQAKQICPGVKVLTPDPPKYRFVHQQLIKVFENFTPDVYPQSIDEAVLKFGCPYKSTNSFCPCFWCTKPRNLFDVGRQIKERIRNEVGEYLTVSIGLGPNRFLAKTAAGLKKPDGLEEINYKNIGEAFNKLKLTDLCGINLAFARRLSRLGIFTPRQFLKADLPTLKAAFRSINARHWYLRLRGFEVDDWSSERKSIGHSYALPQATRDLTILKPILYKLCEKVGRRLRANRLEARGLWIFCLFKGGGHFNHGEKLPQPIFSSSDIYSRALKILNDGFSKVRPLQNLAVSVFCLSPSLYQQQTFFEDQIKKKLLTQALDKICDRFGPFTIAPAMMVGLEEKVLDRIAFGGIRDLPKV